MGLYVRLKLLIFGFFNQSNRGLFDGVHLGVTLVEFLFHFSNLVFESLIVSFENIKFGLIQ